MFLSPVQRMDTPKAGKGGFYKGGSMSEMDEIQKRAREFLEKRRYERFKTSLQVRFRVISPEEKASLFKSGGFANPAGFSAEASEIQDLKQVLTEDISLGGLRIATPQAMPQGIDLWINLGFPEAPMPVSALAKVMWSRPAPGGGTYYSGLQFAAINQQDLAKVEGYLRLRNKKS
jgi:hypothetical protein